MSLKEETSSGEDVKDTNDLSQEQGDKQPKESNPYKEELDRLKTKYEALESKYEEVETIAKHQGGAIKEERARRRELEKSTKERGQDLDRHDEVDIKELVSKASKEAISEFAKQRAADDFEDVLDAVSQSEDEKSLIREIYKRRINPSGYSRRAFLTDLEEAKILANRHKYVAEAEQKARKEFARDSAIRSVSGVPRSTPPEEREEDENLTEAERELIRKMTPSNIKAEDRKRIRERYGVRI